VQQQKEHSMPTIEVDTEIKKIIAFAARMASVSEGEIIRRLIAGGDSGKPVENSQIQNSPKDASGVSIYAFYEGHRTTGRFYPPARVEITDGPLAGQSFKSPTGAARAIVRHYNPNINDNRNGWAFWQLDNDSESNVWLQSIRPQQQS
jgi:hypothetical protein